MLTYKDCADFSDLTEEEIHSVEDGEHLPAIAACARGQGLSASPRGCRLLLKYMLARLEHVEGRNDVAHIAGLQQDLARFARKHHYI